VFTVFQEVINKDGKKETVPPPIYRWAIYFD